MARDDLTVSATDFSTLSVRDVSDIGLQRTGMLLRAPRYGAISYRLWLRGLDWPLRLEAMLRREAILRGALRYAESEWREIASYLPREGASLCDIGCGHAFVDLIASRQCGPRRITLIDIETTSERHHNFHPKGAGYASLASAKRFLIANGVPRQSVETCNPSRDAMPEGPFDLILSLLSAGFHYPVADYARFAFATLKPHGAFIFDMRHGTGQENSVHDFREIRTVSRTERKTRIAAIK